MVGRYFDVRKNSAYLKTINLLNSRTIKFTQNQLNHQKVICMNNLITLDCGSFDSALNSLVSIFGCTPELLREFLSNSEIDQYFENNPQLNVCFKEYIYEIVLEHIGEPQMPDLVTWFHTTRVPAITNFEEGILPLSKILPKLKTMLIDLIDDDLLKEQFSKALVENEINDFHYSNKTNNMMHWGPYAILVRNVAFQAKELGQHDYLDMPEIIEDICNGFKNISGIDLFEQFRGKLKPAIVKFTSINETEEDCIATALCYVRSSIMQGKVDQNCVYCFNGNNKPIPYLDIVCVEFV